MKHSIQKQVFENEHSVRFRAHFDAITDSFERFFIGRFQAKKMKNEGNSWRKRVRSFGYALQGWRALVTREANARIHCVATILVIAAGCYLEVSRMEWIALLFAIGLVLSLEAINSAIEALADTISTDYHPLIGRAKDLAAGAVLFAALTAALIGLLIFVPKVSLLLK